MSLLPSDYRASIFKVTSSSSSSSSRRPPLPTTPVVVCVAFVGWGS